MAYSRSPRMPAHYKRDPLGDLGRDPLAQAVVLSRSPNGCPRCWNPCLRDRGVEMNCPNCGWEQVVWRDVNPLHIGGAL